MSRIGKLPVPVPDKVKIALAGRTLSAEGPKGKGELTYPEGVRAAVDAQARLVRVERDDDSRRALHGTYRALTANLLAGVAAGYEKRLEIQGVGFKATIKGQSLSLYVGYAAPVVIVIPAGVSVQCPDATHVVVSGVDKHKVGEIAARIRGVRPPDVYQGKGIRYAGEVVRKKAGKAAFGAGTQ